MDAKSQEKVVKAGFTIIRVEQSEAPNRRRPNERSSKPPKAKTGEASSAASPDPVIADRVRPNGYRGTKRQQ